MFTLLNTLKVKLTNFIQFFMKIFIAMKNKTDFQGFTIETLHVGYFFSSISTFSHIMMKIFRFIYLLALVALCKAMPEGEQLFLNKLSEIIRTNEKFSGCTLPDLSTCSPCETSSCGSFSAYLTDDRNIKTLRVVVHH